MPKEGGRSNTARGALTRDAASVNGRVDVACVRVCIPRERQLDVRSLKSVSPGRGHHPNPTRWRRLLTQDTRNAYLPRGANFKAVTEHSVPLAVDWDSRLGGPEHYMQIHRKWQQVRVFVEEVRRRLPRGHDQRREPRERKGRAIQATCGVVSNLPATLLPQLRPREV